MVSVAENRTDSAGLNTRIDRMHGRDRMGALAFVVVLWVVVAFALFTIWPAVTDGAIRTILLIAAAVLLVFNTAAIVAMLAHYREDRDHIYGLDLRFLDAQRGGRS